MRLRHAVEGMLSVGVITNASISQASPKQDTWVRRRMYVYAQCVVNARHRLAEQAILSNDPQSSYAIKYPELMIEYCMTKANSDGIKFSGDTYRYALADALVNLDFRNQGPSDFSDRLPLAHARAMEPSEIAAVLAKAKSVADKETIQASIYQQQASAWISSYGECVVRHDPVGTRYWLLTPPDTAEENSRINALAPVFSACLDRTLRFSRVMMRGAVAINYYRLAKATAIPVAQKAN